MSDLSLSRDGELSAEPWFAKSNVDLLFYRVNRRPIVADPTLFEPNPDLLRHLQRILSYAEPGHSGRKNRREWRLGSLAFNFEQGTFVGKLGWAKSAAALGQAWDEESHEWVERVVPRDDSAVAPVAFAVGGRILGVLKHPSFGTTERVLHEVISEMLNAGERREDLPTTVWNVEPLGDTGEFSAWLNDVDQLLLLRMVFERPNPDAEDAFQELFERLDRYHADQIKEEIRARDPDKGLRKAEVWEDRTTRGFLSAALDHAFGRIWARGRRGGRYTVYDQRAQVLRQSIDSVGADWNTATETVLAAVEQRSARQVIDGKRSEGSRILGSGWAPEAK